MLRKNGYKFLLILQLLLILILLPGCFREERLLTTFWGEDIAEQTTPGENCVEFGSRRMELTPGVYKIKVHARLEGNQKLQVEMKSDGTYFRALRGNSVTVFPGDTYEEFNVYVVDKVSNAYVQCGFFDTDAHALEKLEVSKSNLGDRMLLFGVLIVSAALNFMMLLRKRILEGRVTAKQQVVFWTLTAGILLAYFPYLTDYFSFGADTIYHLGRITHLKNTLEQGVIFPVRIQSTWLYDHGYATSMFYGDLFLYIPAFLMVIGFSIMTSYKLFVLVVTIATAMITYHCFKKCVKEEYAALFGSMIYLLTPYRVFNVYSRGAVGEYLAMMFLPLVCCGMYLLYSEDVASRDYKKYKWYVVLGMSGILQSHLISTEMTAVFMALFCVIFWRKTFRRQTLCQLLEATGITLLINAWFWVPLLYMMNCDTYYLENLTQTQVQSRGLFFAAYLQLLPNKGSAQNGMWQCEPVQVGAGAIMLLLVYMLWRMRGKSMGKTGNVLAGFSVLTLVMCTRYLPWDAIMKLPGIGYIVSSLQFPSRWMLLATVFVSLFAAFFFRKVEEESGLLIRAAVGIAAVVAITSAVYHVNNIAFESGPIYLYNAENMGTANVANGEYLLTETSISEMRYHEPVAEEGLTWWDYEKNGTDVSIYLENGADISRYLEIPLTGYKGYGIETEGVEERIPSIAETRGAHGDLRIEVPAGYHGRVRISYQGFAVFHVAEAVSLISLAVIAGMYVYGRRKRVQDEYENRSE